MNIVLLSRSVPCLIACFIAASGLTYIQMDLLYGESSTLDAAESDAQKNVKCKETKSRAMSYSAAFCEYGTRESRVLCMPAIVPAPAIKEDGLYTHPVSAMQIISVEADGKPIYARKYDIDNDEMEFDLWKTFTPSGSMHCYLITMASNYYEISSPKKERIFRLVTCNAMSEDDFDLSEFQVPPNVKKLRVQYRPRYTNGKFGEPLVVIAVRDDEPNP